MRFAIVAVLALAAGACSIKVDEKSDGGPDKGAAKGGYTLEVVGKDAGAQFYRVTAPDGRVTAAKVENGASAIVSSDEVAPLMGEMPVPPGEHVSVKVPGVSIDVNGDKDKDGANGDDHGRVSVNVGGRTIDVQGDDASAQGGRVRIGGADAKEARDFIEKADKLSPETRAAMEAAVGLEK